MASEENHTFSQSLLAEVLDIPRTTLRDWIGDKRLPFQQRKLNPKKVEIDLTPWTFAVITLLVWAKKRGFTQTSIIRFSQALQKAREDWEKIPTGKRRRMALLIDWKQQSCYVGFGEVPLQLSGLDAFDITAYEEEVRRRMNKGGAMRPPKPEKYQVAA